MRTIILLLAIVLLFVVPALGQGPGTSTAANGAQTKASSKRGPVFRPTKDQIRQVQSMLKTKGLYAGEASGTYNNETRAGIKSFQKDNGLRETGTLNRATLEKMNVELTDAQRKIPVSENSFASAGSEKSSAKTTKVSLSAEAKPKKQPIFRATVDQIKEAQRLLKAGAMYTGDENGKLNNETRAGLKKYQESNGLKVTGTLNQITLERMGIALTEKQKADTQKQ